jgi:hypothetical protein
MGTCNHQYQRRTQSNIVKGLRKVKENTQAANNNILQDFAIEKEI